MLYYPVAVRPPARPRPLIRPPAQSCILLLSLSSAFLSFDRGKGDHRPTATAGATGEPRLRPPLRRISADQASTCGRAREANGRRGLQVDGREGVGRRGRARASGRRPRHHRPDIFRSAHSSLARSLPKRWTQLRTNACSAAAVSWSRALGLVRSRKSPAPIHIISVTNRDTTTRRAATFVRFDITDSDRRREGRSRVSRVA